MSIESKYSFLNGAIAGAGIVLAITSIGFLKIIGPLEGKMGITTTEIQVGVFLGFTVFIISILYEIYRTKYNNQHRCEGESKQSQNQQDHIQ